MSPFFTVIIPSYNRADLILKTIHSVLTQTFTDFEVIVVDDGGTDNTDQVLEEITDSRLVYFKKENSERGATRNFGIKIAKGRYITFIDSDDLMYVHALQHAYDKLLSLEYPSCFAQAFEVVDSSSSKLMQSATLVKTDTINEQILKGNFLGCIGVFVKNEILQIINFEEERMFAGTEDWLLWLRLAARYPFYYSNTVCASMIEHEQRSVLSFSEQKLKFRTDFLKEKLQGDTVFTNKFGADAIKKIYAHMLSYTSLHLAMSGKKWRAIQYFFQSIQINSAELFSRRTLGIAKNILIK
jgi:glycosyltransferase involved in cell wall biosynthesis